MDAFRIGRIFGIDIRIHWSWLAIFLLLLWWLAEGFYDAVDAYSHWSAAERWLASGITTVVSASRRACHPACAACVSASTSEGINWKWS